MTGPVSNGGQRFTVPEHERGGEAHVDGDGVLHTGTSVRLTERVEITYAGESR